MLHVASYDIVFQEVPGEVALALNLSGCPNRCPGCHSAHLQGDAGEPLDETLLSGLLARYGAAVSCVCFMGGDAAPGEVARWAAFVRQAGDVREITADRQKVTDGAQKTATRRLKAAWYSGRAALPDGVEASDFDYIKLGPYVEHLGGLDSPTTNQRFYRVANGELHDETVLFRKKY